MIVETKRYKKGAIIYLESNRDLNKFFIVKSGQIMIKRKNPIIGDRTYIKGSGYIFGIVQAITNIPEEESAKTLTDSEIIVIPDDKLEDLYKEHPQIIMKILREYSDILRELDRDLIKHDLFHKIFGRKTNVFEVAKRFIELNQMKKASHLLTSFLTECDHSDEVCRQADDMLKELPPTELFESNEIIENRVFEQGSVLFTEMEHGSCFYIIKRGKIKITKLKKSKEIILAILGPGDILGEMSILNDQPRYATAFVEEVSEIMVIDKKGINSLPPPLFVTILKHLTQRIWLVQQQLICLKLPSPNARIYYFLTSKIKQNIRDIEKESENSFLFKFPLNELYSMIEITRRERENGIEDFLTDKNFEFYYDSIKVKNIGDLFDKNAFYYSRAVLAHKSYSDE